MLWMCNRVTCPHLTLGSMGFKEEAVRMTLYTYITNKTGHYSSSGNSYLPFMTQLLAIQMATKKCMHDRCEDLGFM